MSFDKDRLYALLPAIYRVRDAQQGEPLKALLSVIAEQVAVLEEDLAQLYDDHFIETCSEWAAPYIGDLVGARGIFSSADAQISQRAYVGNTVAYRRRKGTATALEQMAYDVTRWNARVVEYFERLATTQYLNHLRPKNLSFASLRSQVTVAYQAKVEFGRLAGQILKLPNWEALEYLTTPFDPIARTVNVRRIASRRGAYNIPNIGIHLWRVQSFPLNKAAAFRVDARRFRFDPLGRDLPLFNQPQTERSISHLAEPINVPIPLSRRVLSRKLEDYYGEDETADEKSLLVTVDPTPVSSAVPSNDICVCDLSDVKDAAGNVIGWAHMPDDCIAIDPVLGRIALPQDAANVEVKYCYGFVARMGGGVYARAGTFFKNLKTIGPLKIINVPADELTIQDALNELALTGGVIEVSDNGLYFETPAVTVPAGAGIELRAKDGKRPVLFLQGDMTITGGQESQFAINGFWIAGGNMNIAGAANNLEKLHIEHCSLSPAATPNPRPASPPDALLAPVQIKAGVENLTVEISKSIVGALRLEPEVDAVISDSIVDAGSPLALAYADLSENEYGGPLQLRNCTVIGRVRAEILTRASNTIFFARPAAGQTPVEARRLQEGCVRYCYVPPDSQVPRRFQCQPDRALSEAADQIELNPQKEIDLLARVKPVFTSLHFGNPAYGQLSARTPPQIFQGAEDEAEIGAFRSLYQPQRLTNVRTCLDEYLRFGLEAGVFCVT
jgi:hypothetical protein